jgi:catechol 2,3-dioxygenase-like lactoylglutathione lyase family enzyme
MPTNNAALILTALALCASATATAQQIPAARFHHVHLNSVDPEAAIDFYTAKFKAQRQKFAGLHDAVWTGDSWLLFTKVNAPPPADIVSGLWHIGWGAEDMKAAYQKQLGSGSKFFTPLTDISGMAGGEENSGRFFYAYVDGPDHALVELNTANHHHFGHVHMFSADPPAAADWYAKTLGIKLRGARREVRTYHDNQIAPSATLTADHVSMIIYPVEYLKTYVSPASRAVTVLAPTRGRVIDHLGFAVDDLDAWLVRLRATGVKISAEPRSNGPIKFAFIEGPDRVAIELIEDRSAAPGKLPD